MLVVVAAIIGSLALSGVGEVLAEKIGVQICRIGGGNDCGDGTRPPQATGDGDGEASDEGDPGDRGDSGGRTGEDEATGDPTADPAGDLRQTKTQAELDYEAALRDLQAAQDEHAQASDKAKQAAEKLAQILAEELGITDALDCITHGDGSACTETLINVLTSLIGGAVGKLAAKYGAPWKWKRAVALVREIKKHGGDLYDGLKRLVKASKDVRKQRQKTDALRKDLPEHRRKPRTCASFTHSFLAGTPVVLADGTRMAIEDVRVGDAVLVTDVGRGLTTVRPVTRTITTDTDREFTTLTVAVDGRPRTLTATDNHPFWVESEHRWARAEDIRRGMTLRGAEGGALPVVRVAHDEKPRRTYDLTVRGIHTYYVGVGGQAVLVHNNNGDCNRNTVTRPQAEDIASYLGYTKTKRRSAGGAAIWENKKGKPRYITWDRTGHKGGIFKGSNDPNPFQTTRKSGREGSYDLDVSPDGEVLGLTWIAE